MVTSYLYSLPVIPYRYWCFWTCSAKQLPEISANVANVGCPNSRYDSKVATGRKIKFQKHHGTWPFGRGTTLLGGLTITIVINQLLTGMILQVYIGSTLHPWFQWQMKILLEIPYKKIHLILVVTGILGGGYLQGIQSLHSGKTNMSVENAPIEHVFPSEACAYPCDV